MHQSIAIIYGSILFSQHKSCLTQERVPRTQNNIPMQHLTIDRGAASSSNQIFDQGKDLNHCFESNHSSMLALTGYCIYSELYNLL